MNRLRVKAFLLGGLSLPLCAVAQDLSKMELYPGISRAVEAVTRGSASWAAVNETSSGSDFQLLSNRFLPCARETLSINVWLVSQHAKKDRPWELQEKNRGVGFFYSCDGWSTGFDRMVNSNNGKATVFSLLWGRRIAEVGPVFLNGKVGFARVGYEVPRYNVTLYENAKIGFLGVGLTRLPHVTLNIAPVPKVAGNAYIAWVSYEVKSFK